MTVWTLNGQWNLIVAGDTIEYAPPYEQWHFERDGEVVGRGRRGETATLYTDHLAPGECFWLIEPNGRRTTYMVKHPDVDAALERERELELS